MKLALTDEQPPRLAVICNDEEEFDRLEAAVDIYAIRAGQHDRLHGGSTNTTSLNITGLKMDIRQTTVVHIPEATGKERVFVTETDKHKILGDVALNAADELKVETKIQRSLVHGMYADLAEVEPPRNGYYGPKAIEYWEGIGQLCAQPLRSLPVVEVQLLHPTPNHPVQ
jgi:hypothetical protein